MKIWNNYGSEHSANLVMIGHFEKVSDAQKAKDVIDKIEQYIKDSGDDHRNATRYSEGMLEFLDNIKFYSVQPSEIEQFAYQYRTELKEKDIILTTDEMDVSGYLKLLVDYGARVEVYSAHVHKGTGEGR